MFNSSNQNPQGYELGELKNLKRASLIENQKVFKAIYFLYHPDILPEGININLILIY